MSLIKKDKNRTPAQVVVQDVVKVKKGDYVTSGKELATAGVDPRTKKPQITFMVFQNGQPLDPMKAPRN